jgi:hypothetical protein
MASKHLRTYDAILALLGYEKDLSESRTSYSRFMEPPTSRMALAQFTCAKPVDDKAATGGNGAMPAFCTESRAKINELHAAGIASGV